MGYDAFISYSHDTDGDRAKAIEDGLERFAKPWHRRRSLNVFRDSSGLSANPGLWTSISEVMEQSDWLVILCSPESAASPWVGREIEHWIASKPEGRILPVLTAGELVWDEAVGTFDVEQSTAANPALAAGFAEEPLWVDLRFADTPETQTLRDPRFNDGIADLAAPMHGLAKDELIGEDIRQHRRTLRFAWAAVLALLLLALGTVVGATAAARSASEAAQNSRKAEQLADEVINANLSIEALGIEQRAAEEKLKATESVLAESETALGNTEGQLAATANQLGSTTNELNATNSELNATNSELDATQGDLATSQSALDDTQNELGITQNQLGDTQSQLGATQSDLETTQDNLDVKSGELTDKQGQLDDANDALTEANDNLAKAGEDLAEAQFKFDVASAQAQATALAAESTTARLDGDLDTALLLAVAAVKVEIPAESAGLESAAARSTEDPVAPARRALTEAVQTARGGLLTHLRVPGPQTPGAFGAVAVSPDGARVAAAETDADILLGKRAPRLYVWPESTTPGDAPIELAVSDDLGCVERLEWNATGEWLLTVENPDGCLEAGADPAMTAWMRAAFPELQGFEEQAFVRRTVRLWDLRAATPQLTWTNTCATANGLAASPIDINVDRTLVAIQGLRQDVNGNCHLPLVGPDSETGKGAYQSARWFEFATQEEGFGPTVISSALTGGTSFTPDGTRLRGYDVVDHDTGISSCAALWNRSTDEIDSLDPLGQRELRADPTGTVIAQISADGSTIELFDAATATPRQRISLPGAIVDQVALVTPHLGFAAVTNANESCLVMFDSTGGSVLIECAPVLSDLIIERSRSGRYLVLERADVSVGSAALLFDWKEFRFVPVETGIGERIIGFSAAEDYAVTQTTDPSSLRFEAAVWDLAGESAEKVAEKKGARATLAPDGSAVAFARWTHLGAELIDSTESVSVVQFVDGVATERTLASPKGRVEFVAFDEVGGLVGVGRLRYGLAWDLDRRPFAVVANQGLSLPARMAVSPWDGTTVATTVDGTTLDLTRDKATVPSVVTVDDGFIEWMRFSRDGRRLFVNVDPDGDSKQPFHCTVVEFDENLDLDPVREFDLSGGEECTAFSGDGESILSRGGDGSMRVRKLADPDADPWKIDTSALDDDRIDFTVDVFTADWTGDRVAGTNATGQSVVWHRTDGFTKRSPDLETTPLKPFSGVAFNRNGDLAVKTPDGIVRLYAPGEVEAAATLRTEVEAERGARLQFSDDGSLLLIDGVYTLDAQTLDRLGPRMWPDHWDNIGLEENDVPDTGSSSTQFTHDGKHVLAVRANHTEAVRFDIGVEDLVLRLVQLRRLYRYRRE